MTPAPTDSIFYFSVSVSYTDCEALYHSPHTAVILVDDRGVRVQVPASALKRFITSTGIKGRFRLIVDKQKKIRAFERIA
ncbi:DUF2835 family protein [Alteromonas sp. CYL-A6]|uniref:DUF2835 family protein n=1 Tax=Alteromonas nitratireducens TaxID=3390813 RepID=UPI0034B63258